MSRHPGGLEIVIPPARLRAPQIAAFLFLAIWFAITSRLTWHGRNPWLFALPFWAAGVGLTSALVLSLVQTIRIAVGPQTTTLEKRPFGYRRSFATGEIVVRVGQRVQQDGQDRGQALLVEYGTKTYALMQWYSDQERRWVADEIRKALSS